jgi:hypothetical protein
MSKVVDSVWFNNIGIVLVLDEYDGYKCYIGLSRGFDQKSDEIEIAVFGSRFKLEAAAAYFPQIKQNIYEELARLRGILEREFPYSYRDKLEG